MIIMADEGLDLGFDITGQEAVFEQDVILSGNIVTVRLFAYFPIVGNRSMTALIRLSTTGKGAVITRG